MDPIYQPIRQIGHLDIAVAAAEAATYASPAPRVFGAELLEPRRLAPGCSGDDSCVACRRNWHGYPVAIFRLTPAQGASKMTVIYEGPITGEGLVQVVEVTGLRGYGHDGSALRFKFVLSAENWPTGYELHCEPPAGSGILAAAPADPAYA